MSVQPNKVDQLSHPKSFLDTSVLRPLLTGASYHRNYLGSVLDAHKTYLTLYVLMEFRRSLYRDLLALYNVLDMPEILTLEDARKHLSNSYGRTAKTLLQNIGALQPFFDNQKIDFQKPGHKQLCRVAIAKYLKRLEIKLEAFSDTGEDRTRCGRAVKPNFEKLDDGHALDEFALRFNDVKTCRKKCSIDAFFLQTYKSQTNQFIAKGKQIDLPSEHKGFLGVVESLEDVLDKQGKNCTCFKCASIGDAVVALSCPEKMVLEHIDESLNDLSEAIHIQHRHLDSDTAVLSRLTKPQ